MLQLANIVPEFPRIHLAEFTRDIRKVDPASHGGIRRHLLFPDIGGNIAGFQYQALIVVSGRLGTLWQTRRQCNPQRSDLRRNQREFFQFGKHRLVQDPVHLVT